MILVTGASGFVASHLIPRLQREGHRLRCLVTNAAEGGRIKAPGAELAIGNVTDPASLPDAMEGVETVIHLVAVIREKGPFNFRKVNVEGTQNVVEAAKKAGVRRFIHMGALGATPDPAYKYLNSKWLGMEAVKASGLDWSILMPSVMFGEGAGFIASLLRSIHMAPFIVPVAGDGKTMLQPIWVGDVANCVLKLLEGQKIGQSVAIGGPEIMTYDELIGYILAALGEKRFRLHVPRWLMKPGVAVMEALLSNPPITMVEFKSMEIPNITDPEAVEKEFGFKPMPIRDGLGYLKIKT
ncbi:complex I NDUFA9 subunit family protein [Dehalogenimonas alkenigignens]|uniref:Nucleoside-diphosphate-sugar epimerase n=1 Tax=Dehalogenimonas alkenigignens TaxID=1217799 RepID=A0A0W0GI69_9CHLR|nr:complex I NDUFA9 subunit family protein [Dehalogenimonas alkenigignens]KTB48222.1 Nucleoside-diphosphate-sugar epimerase [Dehalogenimonas alkenigignens]PVV84460.1 complex I NDUFA9 subunit family protein [Dehalogenimonas alkenigignens]